MDPAQLAAIDLNLLVVLDVLLAERSVTRAAARLGLTQPAVSNALARLRTALDDPLLVRAANTMAPTPRALELAGPLRDALERVNHVVAGPGEFHPDSARRTFTLAATDYVQFVLLGRLASRLETEAPGVSLRVLPVHSWFPWPALESGAVDLTLGGAQVAPRGLHRRTLFRDRVVCIVRADHPVTRGTWNLDKYLSLTHVEALPTEGMGLADEVLAELGRARRCAVTVSQFLVAPFVVPHTDHCFTLAERIARPLAEQVPVRVLPIPFEMPEITIWSFWHERVHDDPAHKWLRRALADVAGTLPALGRAPRAKRR